MPNLVHCSTGNGRTGMFIALWNLMDETLETNSPRVSATVEAMRNYRQGMVETEDQYMFISRAASIACWPLLRPLSIKAFKRIELNSSYFYNLFESLATISENFNMENDLSFQEENLPKNRYSGPFYAESYLAHIFSFIPPEGNTYINAAFVDNHYTKGGMIATQAPLPNTINDFWALVLDQQVTQIVILNKNQKVIADAPNYWPKNGEKGQYGNVEVYAKHVIKAIKLREFSLTQKSHTNSLDSDSTGVTVSQWHLRSWPEVQSVPNNIDEFIQILERVLHHSRANCGKRTLVHCEDGCFKTGLFIACFNILQGLEESKYIHISSVILIIRETQKHFIADVEQLRFCFEVVRRFTQKSKKNPLAGLPFNGNNQ